MHQHQSNNSFMIAYRLRPFRFLAIKMKQMDYRTKILIVVSLAIFIDILSYSVVLPFLPFVVEKQGQNQSITGIILAAYSIGLLLSSLVFGVVSDRTNNQKGLMVFGLGLMIFASASMAIFENLWVLSIGRFLQGVSSGITWVSGLALLGANNNPKEIGVKMGFVMGSYGLGQFVGPLIGGYFYTFGYCFPFIIITVGAVIDLIMRILWVKDRSDVVKKAETSIISGLKCVFTCRPAIIILSVGTIAAFVIGSLELGIVLVLKEHFSLTEEKVGLFFMVFVVPQLLISLIGGWLYDKVGFKRVTSVAALACSCSIGLMALIDSLTIYGCMIAMFSVSITFFLSGVLPELTKVVPESVYGATFGIFNFAFGVGLLFGPIFMSFMFQFTSWMIYCISMAMLFLLALPIVLIKPEQAAQERSETTEVFELE